MHVLRVLRIRHLAVLWLSQVLSAMGDYLYQIAVMWIAVKAVGSGAGIVAAAEAGSLLVFGLHGGVYADRWNRRTVMICVDILRAIAVASLPVLALTGTLQLWHLIVVAVVVGSLSSLFDPALQASLPTLAANTQILQATNSLMDVTRRLARILGPSLAGVLVALLPLPHFFTLDAISFAISAITVFTIGKRFAWRPVPAQDVSQGLRGILTEINGAMRLLRQHQLLAWALSISGVSNLVWSAAFTVGVPLLTVRVLGSNVGAYGLIVSAYGIGNVISNLVIGSLTIRRRSVVIFIGKIVLASGFLVLAFAHTLVQALLGASFAAIGGPMVDITIITMMQTDLPSNQFGKIYSLRMIMESAGASLGLLLAVPMFAYLSVPIGIALCALIMLSTGVAGLIRFGVSEPVLPGLLDKQQDRAS